MFFHNQNDTISAIATPFGTAGVGVVRLSGNRAFEIVEKIFSNKNLIPNQITHGWIKDGETLIDEVIVLPFKAPKSYTGEDVVEIQCHGGVQIVREILNLTIKNGARLAERGEYTKRAFLNGKMDLSQAEAVLDLIHAKTEKFAVKSANNLSGKLSIEIEKIRKQIFDLLSKIVAAIDFPEDIKEPEYSDIEEELRKILSEIDNILAVSKSSNILRQGIKLVIAGKPNVGKSSLFNRLLNLDRAIVTDIAGTTRDVLQETLNLDGIPLTISDTAGIRNDENIDKVEAIGIDCSKNYIEEANIVLFLYDLTQGFQEDDKEIYQLIKNKTHIQIGTKADLTDKRDDRAVCISAVSGENIEALRVKIKELVLGENNLESEFVTNERQQKCLENAKKSLLQALETTISRDLQDLISIDIKAALLSIGEISGEVITDDILNNIFDNFCIGK